MLDGFDEISPFYKDTVIDLVQALRQTAVEQLWVTTRPHLREELEDKLQQLSYTLEPFSEENQVEFLTKFWSLQDWFIEMDNTEKEESKPKLEIYGKKLIEVLTKSVSDRDRQFTGIPLQTRLLVEAFNKEVRTFFLSAESMPEISFKLDLLGLYGRFIERKYDIYQEEKLQVNITNVTAIEQREHLLTDMINDHQLLALKVLFTEEQVTKIQNNRKCKFSAEELTRIGIVQVRHDGKPHFIHRTLAEYYVADCLVNCLTEGNNTSEQVQTFILKDVFQKEDYLVVRVFIDGLLSRFKPSEQVLKEYGNLIHGLWKDSQQVDNDGDDCDDDDDDSNDYDDDYDVVLIPFVTWRDRLLQLQIAVSEGNANIIGFLLDSAQATKNTHTVNKLLLAQDEKGRTAWHQAVFSHNIQVSEKLWECAKRNPRAHDLRKKLLFAKDFNKMNAWHLAVQEGKIEVLLKQLELAKEELLTEEVKKLLLDTDCERRTVLHLAAMFYKPDIFHEIQKLIEWNIKRNKLNEILDEINEGMTVFKEAARFPKLEVFQGILNLVKENLTTEEVHKLLYATDIKGRTVFHVAARFCELEVFQEIFNWTKENLKSEGVNKLLLARDNKGRTVIYVAARFSTVELFQEIFNWAK